MSDTTPDRSTELELRRALRRLDGRTDTFGEVRVRRGIIDAVNGDGTYDVELDGIVKSDVWALRGAVLDVGDPVRVDYVDGSPLILGATDGASAGGAAWDPGDVKLAAHAATPDGWLECLGQAVSRTTYADLFAAIGTAYGAGNGSTSFNVPDLRGRVPIGFTNGSTVNGSNVARGTTLGSATVVLTTAQLASHSHGSGTLDAASDGSHQHSTTGWAANTAGSDRFQGNNNAGSGSFSHPTNSAGAHTHSVTGSTGSAGSGDAHENRQPSLGVRYLIRT